MIARRKQAPTLAAARDAIAKLEKMPLLGAHMSIAGGFHRAVEHAHAAGCDVVQLFTAAPQQWPKLRASRRVGQLSTKTDDRSRAAAIAAEEAALFAAKLAELKIGHPIAHACYLINLASPDPRLRQKSVEAMVIELARADQLGIPFVVVHPGAHRSAGEEEGIALVAQSINEIHRRLPNAQAQITLEITAGQGTCLGWRLEQLAAIIDLVQKSSRVGVCVDTCHAFAAGYDLRDRRGYSALWRQFDELLGLDRLKAIHLNDSKRGLGSRIDRHEHIGRGQIGAEGFRRLLRDKRFRYIPMYLETPKGTSNGQPWDVVNLRVLRELARK